ncbi:MAG: hypothetical protein DWQ07_17700 [Chloroflexi bacterium]|nr:MAG: hypothetical protein DWQ07_17700 [Chloroflexota bacterium]
MIEPAGLGAFSLLAGEFVEHVTYYSHTTEAAWRLRLSPENLHTLEAEIVALPLKGVTGLRIDLQLNSSVMVKKEYIKTARSLYPYSLHWRENGYTEYVEIERDFGFSAHLDFQTPIGRVRWSGFSAYTSRAEIVWEHRRIQSAVFRDALSIAASLLPEPGLASHVVRGRVQWFPNDDTLVRPRLPDRSEMIADQALAEAANQVLAAVCDRIMQATRFAAANWPERFSVSYSTKLPGTEEIPWLNDNPLLSAILPELGWHYVREVDPRTFRTWEGDGLEGEVDITTFFDRYAQVVHDPIISLSIFNQMDKQEPEEEAMKKFGPVLVPQGAVFDPQAPQALVHAENPRYDVELSPFIALADSLEVEGIGPLPYLITTNMGQSFSSLGLELGEAVILFGGTVEDFLAAMANDDLFVHLVAYALYDHGELYSEDWIDYDDEYHLDVDQIAEDLALQVTGAYQPQMLERRQAYYTWKHRNSKLGMLLRDLRSLLFKPSIRQSTPGDVLWLFGLKGLEILLIIWSKVSGLQVYLLQRRARLRGNL